jgi:hypothetical protein
VGIEVCDAELNGLAGEQAGLAFAAGAAIGKALGWKTIGRMTMGANDDHP